MQRVIAILFIINQKLKATQRSINRSVDKQTGISYNRILFYSKKHVLLIHTTIWMNLKINTLSERSHTKTDHILYDYLYKILGNSN